MGKKKRDVWHLIDRGRGGTGGEGEGEERSGGRGTARLGRTPEMCLIKP